MCVRESVCECVCERERECERERVCERVRERVCACESECVRARRARRLLAPRWMEFSVSGSGALVVGFVFGVLGFRF